jgi:hypothetical protein
MWAEQRNSWGLTDLLHSTVTGWCFGRIHWSQSWYWSTDNYGVLSSCTIICMKEIGYLEVQTNKHDIDTNPFLIRIENHEMSWTWPIYKQRLTKALFQIRSIVDAVSISLYKRELSFEDKIWMKILATCFVISKQTLRIKAVIQWNRKRMNDINEYWEDCFWYLVIIAFGKSHFYYLCHNLWNIGILAH